MTFPSFDRRKLHLKSLAERRNKVAFPADAVSPDAAPRELPPREADTLRETAERIRAARRAGRPVICAFGAHTIKNGLGPVLIRLIERGWVTHLATNGAGRPMAVRKPWNRPTSPNLTARSPRPPFFAAL